MPSSATILLASLLAATAIPVGSLSIPTGLDFPVIGDSITAPGDGDDANFLPPIPALTAPVGSIGDLGNVALGDWKNTFPSSDFNSDIYSQWSTPVPETSTQTSPSIIDGNLFIFH